MKDRAKSSRNCDNVDTLGKKWRLAHGGQSVIDQSTAKLFEIHAEIRGLATLFTKMAESPEQDDFYGVGLALHRLSRRIAKISDRLSSAITDQPTKGIPKES